ncbi:MAG: hypothetical protein ABI268_09930, partial [Rhodanobacter sp.]
NAANRTKSDVDDFAAEPQTLAQNSTDASSGQNEAEPPMPDKPPVAMMAAGTGQSPDPIALQPMPAHALPQVITVHPAEGINAVPKPEPVTVAPSAFSARNSFGQDASTRKNP